MHPIFHSTTAHLAIAVLAFCVLIASGAVLTVDYAECVTFGQDQCDARDAQRYGIASMVLGALGILFCLIMFFKKRHWVGKEFYVVLTFLASALLLVAGALGTNLHSMCNSFGNYANANTDWGFQIAVIVVGGLAMCYFLYVAYKFLQNPDRYHILAEDLESFAKRLDSIGIRNRDAINL